jgi:hypothetical protein
MVIVYENPNDVNYCLKDNNNDGSSCLVHPNNSCDCRITLVMVVIVQDIPMMFVIVYDNLVMAVIV